MSLAGQVTPVVEGLELGSGVGEGLVLASELEGGTAEEIGTALDVGELLGKKEV